MSLRALHVLEVPPAVWGRTVRPAALRALLALGEVHELVGELLVLVRQRERHRNRRLVDPVRLQLLDGREPLVLVHVVARDQEREHVANTRVPRQVVEARRLQPALRLRGHVVTEVRQEVAAGDDVGGAPRVALAVVRRRTEPGDDVVLRVHRTQDQILPVTVAAHDGPEDPRPVAVHRLLGLYRALLEQTSDHGGDHLDVADLLGGDVHDHVAILGRSATVPSLEEVAVHYAHLAPLPRQELLHLLGEDRVRSVRLGVVLELLGV
nr:hypothetical protein [Rubrobacter marinus]